MLLALIMPCCTVCILQTRLNRTLGTSLVLSVLGFEYSNFCICMMDVFVSGLSCERCEHARESMIGIAACRE